MSTDLDNYLTIALKILTVIDGIAIVALIVQFSIMVAIDTSHKIENQKWEGYGWKKMCEQQCGIPEK